MVRCTFRDVELRSRWLEWMRAEHGAAVCAAGALAAEVLVLDGEPPAAEARYTFASRAAFARYEAEHAPRLRAQGLQRFPPESGVGIARSFAEVDARLGPLPELVVVGPGQLGQLLGAGALADGRRVTAIARDSAVERALAGVALDAPIAVCVGERDLEGAVAGLPEERHGHLVLVQNELFPSTWQALGLAQPTVAVVWMLVKPGAPRTVAAPTRVFGLHAADVAGLHAALELPCAVLPDADALGLALVEKYAFIVAVNGLGVASDETVGAWLARDRARVERLAHDGARLGAALLGRALAPEPVTEVVLAAAAAFADMRARGRTAGERVSRALAHARRLGVAVPELARL